jgi:dihydrofolate reductase
MGRGTYEDIAKRRRKNKPNFRVLLPKRKSYVLSRTRSGEIQGAVAVTSVEQAMDHYQKHNDDFTTQTFFLLGGFHVWIQYWNYVDTIHMTIVPGKYDTNKKFPIQFIDKEFDIVDGRKEETEQGEIMFVEYKRKPNETKRRHKRTKRSRS